MTQLLLLLQQAAPPPSAGAPPYAFPITAAISLMSHFVAALALFYTSQKHLDGNRGPSSSCKSITTQATSAGFAPEDGWKIQQWRWRMTIKARSQWLKEAGYRSILRELASRTEDGNDHLVIPAWRRHIACIKARGKVPGSFVVDCDIAQAIERITRRSMIAAETAMDQMLGVLPISADSFSNGKTVRQPRFVVVRV